VGLLSGEVQAAATFSSRWATEDVSGTSRISGEGELRLLTGIGRANHEDPGAGRSKGRGRPRAGYPGQRPRVGIVRGRRLTEGEKRGNYRVSPVVGKNSGTFIFRADLADFMLDQVVDNTYLGRMPVVSY
jgi:hypothetical protein